MPKPTIQSCHALEILDSRGNPTLQVTVRASNGAFGTASVPSGASTGEHEAFELRDLDWKRYGGKGVLNAVSHVEGLIAKNLQGIGLEDQEAIDHRLIQLDGTPNKKRLGANAILGVSLACAHCMAAIEKKPLYQLLSSTPIMPLPMMNILNGGVHADNLLDFQEFLICPKSAPSWKEALRFGAEVFHALKALLKKKGLSTSVGDEGGFAPALSSHEEALDSIVEAIESAGFVPGKDISLAIDCAASEFFVGGSYVEKKKKEEASARSSLEQIAYLTSLTKKYPIESIEDGCDQNDWNGWILLTQTLGDTTQIVGDDIFVTNTERISQGIAKKAANAVLIKPNQIGTLTETKKAIDLAKSHGWNTILSHRSGETEDTTIADLAVGFGTGQIKTGAPCRSERVAKYNRLLAIEKEIS